MNESQNDHEELVRKLMDDEVRESYKQQFHDVHVCTSAKILGSALVFLGTVCYGARPSYGKFKAIEIIARIPYQSWEAAAYTLVSAFHEDEEHAVRLAKTSAFARGAQDNETMHVVVISQLARVHRQTGFFRFTLLPVIFALFYYWSTYLLYFVSRRAAYELNFLFESHAYDQYEKFLKSHESHLQKHMIDSHFLSFYGRHVQTEYEFFETVRNDELIHRNRSLSELQKSKEQRATVG